MYTVWLLNWMVQGFQTQQLNRVFAAMPCSYKQFDMAIAYLSVVRLQSVQAGCFVIITDGVH